MTTRPLLDAGAWTQDELFWPAFLFHVGMARSASAAFDVDLADLDAYLDRFRDPGRWPVFAASVSGGTLYLIVRNLPGDVGIDWVLDAAMHSTVWAAAAAAAGGDQAGPGLLGSLLPSEPAHLLVALPAVGDDRAERHTRAGHSGAPRCWRRQLGRRTRRRPTRAPRLRTPAVTYGFKASPIVLARTSISCALMPQVSRRSTRRASRCVATTRRVWYALVPTSECLQARRRQWADEQAGRRTSTRGLSRAVVCRLLLGKARLGRDAG
jgi:hypothetical protein